MSGIATFQGGRPFNVNLNTGVNNGAPSWPNRIGSGVLDEPDRALWFDPTAFVAPPANTYGDVGRGVLYSPGQKNIDASLTRRFGFVGRSNLMVRLDAFNLTNTPYFGFPNAEHRLAHGRPDHDDHRRQPHSAARAQGGFLDRLATALGSGPALGPRRRCPGRGLPSAAGLKPSRLGTKGGTP